MQERKSQFVFAGSYEPEISLDLSAGEMSDDVDVTDNGHVD